jgi:hypothetical protein
MNSRVGLAPERTGVASVTHDCLSGSRPLAHRSSDVSDVYRLMPLEVLHIALVLFGCGARFESAEIAAFAGLRIELAGIEPVFAGLQFADHGTGLRLMEVHGVNFDRPRCVPAEDEFQCPLILSSLDPNYSPNFQNVNHTIHAESAWQNFTTIFVGNKFKREGEPSMRIAKAIIAGSIAALAVLAAPALAKNSSVQKTDEPPAPPPCHSYVQEADGSWKPIPCQELGPGQQAQHKPAAGSTDNATQ